MTTETPNLLAGYPASIGRGKLSTYEEEMTLCRAAKKGDREARARLVEKNLRLDDGEPATLAALSKELGLSKERIRVLQRNMESALRDDVAGGEALLGVVA